MNSFTAHLATLDWLIIGAFFAVVLTIGSVVAKRAGKNSESFFLGGRNMPWWILGISMVATTFSADTPNLVANLTREHGVMGNWVWWAQLLTGMTTVFIYAKLWRRSKVMTDVEFYEVRYSGKSAAFLRGFRALYLGAFFNILIMATVILAAIKIGGVMFGFSPLQTILVTAAIVTIYSMLGGLTGVLITDLIMFTVAMSGSVFAAIYCLKVPEVGGLSGLLTHEYVTDSLNFLPNFASGNMSILIPIFILPLSVLWWATYYPGAEPGGGGYIAQKMFAAKDEKGSVKATLFFVVMHYALRPWPWIIVALCSLIVYPDILSLQNAFPHMSKNVVGHDMAYSAMLVKSLPVGILGLVTTSLLAAFMSTVASLLNWGSSYIVIDFYKRFINPDANGKKEVFVGRVSTVLLMAAACCLALLLSNAMDAFYLLLQIGAGTGLIFILRWFWWRVNAFTEITGMVVSFVASIGFFVYNKILLLSSEGQALVGQGLSSTEAIRQCGGFGDWQITVFIIFITTAAWLLVTFISPATDDVVLRNFYEKIHPSKFGWNTVVKKAKAEGVYLKETTKEDNNLPMGILCTVIGCITVYSALFSTGYFLYGQYPLAILLVVIAVGGAIFIAKSWRQIISAPEKDDHIEPRKKPKSIRKTVGSIN